MSCLVSVEEVFGLLNWMELHIQSAVSLYAVLELHTGPLEGQPVLSQLSSPLLGFLNVSSQETCFLCINCQTNSLMEFQTKTFF